ncbi:MAG: 50S ribosomal protein L11 methyltransferase [Anaerolineaceae bacterium]|nr:50S ribosomal protein L11 methyltransferase [Anaerolineaceae bacterium]
MEKAHWLEISLSVSGELAEAVAEVISRFATNGVVCEQGVDYSGSDVIPVPAGPVKVFGYLPIDEDLEDTRQRLEEALWHLSQIEPLPQAAYREIVDQDWMQVFKDHYQPIPVGEKLLILPAWANQEDLSRIAVRIDPSMAFGTGTHPTTQLCMLMLEKYTNVGDDLIDVGCGSGILSIAALKLGATKALAVDVDGASVIATRENGERNGVLDQIEVGKGSVSEILDGGFSFAASKLVVVNILAPIILRLFDVGLADLVEPGGTLILSGILDRQADEIRVRAESLGFQQIDQEEITDWVSMTFHK